MDYQTRRDYQNEMMTLGVSVVGCIGLSYLFQYLWDINVNWGHILVLLPTFIGGVLLALLFLLVLGYRQLKRSDKDE